MYSGFITPYRVIDRLGVHQRFNLAAYRAIRHYLPGGFPSLRRIQSFEGLNGPDGLKVKSPGNGETNQLYDPIAGTGDVPRHIRTHYDGLVVALENDDPIRASFEAAWLSHYIVDGLTPAHHYPLNDRVNELLGQGKKHQSWLAKNLIIEGGLRAALRKNWALWGRNGFYSTHQKFELGVAFGMWASRLKEVISDETMIEARSLGPVGFFKAQADQIASLRLYHRLYEEGWSKSVATDTVRQMAPRIVRAVAAIWLLAAIEAEQKATIRELAPVYQAA